MTARLSKSAPSARWPPPAEGLKPKPRQLANGETVQAICYRVGPLAHLLKNRFYLGEVVYRGEIWRGEHAPILDTELFEAVQQRLKEQAVERSTRRLSSPALLAGKLFDDRGNPMTPTYASKTCIAAGVVNQDGSAKYTGLHRMRHFFASWCINRKSDGGLELPLKVVQERMGHSSITMTADRYSHLFSRGDDHDEFWPRRNRGSWKG